MNPWKILGPSIWTNLSLLHPRMHCAKFGWNWTSEFLNLFNVFLQFPNYLPLEKDWAFHLNKLEFPLPIDALCQVWLKWVQCFLRRFLHFVIEFLLFCNYLPSKKGWIPFTPGCFVPCFVEIDPLILEKKMKKFMTTTMTTTTTDNRQIFIRKALNSKYLILSFHTPIYGTLT